MRASSNSASRASSSPSASAETCSRSLSFIVSFPIQQGLQSIGYGFARAEYPRSHGSDRTVHGSSDLLVAHAFQFAQHDRGTQFFRQFVDGAFHRQLYFVGKREAFRRRNFLEPGIQVVLLRVLQVQLPVNRAASLRDKMVFRGIDRNTVQPRIERAVAAEP